MTAARCSARAGGALPLLLLAALACAASAAHVPSALDSAASLADASLAQWADAASALYALPADAGASSSPLTPSRLRELTAAFMMQEHVRLEDSLLPPGAPPAARSALVRSVHEQQPALVGKRRLPPGARIVVFGDLHGKLDSMLRALTALQRDGLLDTRGCAQPNVFLVFCGDLVDRGPHGPETLALAMALRLQAPERVMLLRGNHESARQNEEGGYAAQLRAKGLAAAFVDSAAHAPPPELHGVALPLAPDAPYAFMPVALFVAADDAASVAAAGAGWLGFMHGGIELGVSVQALLAAPAPAALAVIGAPGSLVGAVDRAGWMRSLDGALRARLQRAAASTDAKAAFASRAHAGAWPLRAEDQQHYPLQFRWADFSDDADDLFSAQFGRMKLGRELTQRWLAENGVVALFRGHQHNGRYFRALEYGEDKALAGLGSGVLDSWGAAQLVTTIISAGRLFGDEAPAPLMNPDAFALLQLGAAGQPAPPSAWTLQACSGRPNPALPLALRADDAAASNPIACVAQAYWHAPAALPAQWRPELRVLAEADGVATSDPAHSRRAMSVRRLRVTTAYAPAPGSPAAPLERSVFNPAIFLEWHSPKRFMRGAVDERRRIARIGDGVYQRTEGSLRSLISQAIPCGQFRSNVVDTDDGCEGAAPDVQHKHCYCIVVAAPAGPPGSMQVMRAYMPPPAGAQLHPFIAALQALTAAAAGDELPPGLPPSEARRELEARHAEAARPRQRLRREVALDATEEGQGGRQPPPAAGRAAKAKSGSQSVLMAAGSHRAA